MVVFEVLGIIGMIIIIVQMASCVIRMRREERESKKKYAEEKEKWEETKKEIEASISESKTFEDLQTAMLMLHTSIPKSHHHFMANFEQSSFRTRKEEQILELMLGHTPMCAKLALKTAWYAQGEHYYDITRKALEAGLELAPDLNALCEIYNETLAGDEHARSFLSVTRKKVFLKIVTTIKSPDECRRAFELVKIGSKLESILAHKLLSEFKVTQK